MSFEKHQIPKIEKKRKPEIKTEKNIRNLENKYHQVEQKVKKLEQKDPIKAETARSKLGSLKEWMTISISSAMTLAAIAEVNNLATRYNVEKIKHDNEITYKHQDPETNRWLNYITGRESLPREIRLEIFRGEIQQELEAYHLNIPANLQ